MPDQFERPEDEEQRRANRVYLERLAAFFVAIGISVRRMETLQRSIGADVRRGIERIPASATPDRVRRTITQIVRRHEPTRRAIVQAAVEDAAARGTDIIRRQAGAAFGDAAAELGLLSREARAGVARAVTRARAGGAGIPDGRTITARMRRESTRAARGATDSINRVLRQTRTLREASEAIIAEADVEVAIPAYVREIREAARSGEAGAVRAAVQRHAAAFRDGRIDEHNIARANRAFVRRVERAAEADIDAAVDEWIVRRAGNHARTVLRTEATAALNESYFATTAEEEWIMGYRVTLSTSHPRPDICDVIANQNLYGLGPGGYPTDATPSLPIHPNCLCHLESIIDTRYFERRRARREGRAEPPRPWEDDNRMTGREYLAQLSRERRAELLGPGRAREFDRRPTRVVNADGSLNPLYQIQDRPRPTRAPVEGRRVSSGGRLRTMSPPPARTRQSRAG